uniref:diacylglycerol cholinephosphotransferase n=1 Tax=Trichuris muris TaxID=70415 RepID=A0A5S6QU23_TRIMR
MLSQVQLKRLLEHKYSAQDESLLSQLFMNKFWNAVVNHFPLWVSPNALTVSGLLLNIASTVILVWYSPDGIMIAPQWVYVLCAITLFIYQTLDATDGKQARRTQTSSPLGELFDHGCDALSQTFITMQICLSMRLGHVPFLIMLYWIFATVMFYSAHWQAYVSGVLRFSRFDVTEAQFCTMALCMASGLFGPNIWMIEIFGVQLRFLVTVFAATVALISLYATFAIIFTGGVGKNGSTIADTSVLFPVFPLLAVAVPAIIIFRKSSSAAFFRYISLYYIAFGIVAAKVTCRLVVAHMTRSELQISDSIFYGPLMLFFNQYFDSCIPEYPLLVVCTVYCAVNFLLYATLVIRQICEYLHIQCFRITPRVVHDR